MNGSFSSAVVAEVFSDPANLTNCPLSVSEF
jgi:hypothetical protein